MKKIYTASQIIFSKIILLKSFSHFALSNSMHDNWVKYATCIHYTYLPTGFSSKKKFHQNVFFSSRMTPEMFRLAETKGKHALHRMKCNSTCNDAKQNRFINFFRYWDRLFLNCSKLLKVYYLTLWSQYILVYQ